MNYSFFTPPLKKKYGYDYILNIVISPVEYQFPPESSPG